MPRFVNPNPYHTPQQQPTLGADPTGGATIDALLLRAKQAREAQSAAMPAQIASPWQGASMMVNRLAEGMQARGAEQAANEGRAEVARLIAGGDPTTGALSPEAQARVMQLAPELGMKLYEQGIAARRADLEYQRNRADKRTDLTESRAYEQSDQIADEKRQAEAEATKLKEQRDWDLAHPKEQWDEIEPGKFQEKNSGRIEFKQPPAAPDAYRPMTPEDYSKFGITPDPSKPMTFNTAKNRPEPIGSGSGITINNGPPSLTESQATTSNYFGRADAAEKIIQPLEKLGTERMTQAGDIPLVGNFLLSDNQQSYRRAKEDFITAVLRKESGATIQDSEFNREDRKYFPQPGDSDQVIADKRTARAQAILGLKAGAGPGAAVVTPPSPTPAPEPQSGPLGDQPPATPAPAAPAAPTPAPQQPPKILNPDDPDREAGLLAAAASALKSGKSRAVVEKILRDQGVDPSKLPQVP